MEDNRGSRISVSVIIPTYNRAALLAAAIDSVLSQSCVPDEILVVDDGSTDETPEVLSRYGRPVRVIRQENRGRSAARNAGLQAATTDAVIFLDSDDLMMPQCVQRCRQVLGERPAVGVVYTDAYLCDGDGRPVGRYSELLPGRRPSGMVLAELMRRNFLTVTSMVRRSCLGALAFDEGMECHEDTDLWRRLAVRCQFHYLDEPLLCYRLHEEMTSATRRADMLAAETEVQRRIMAMPEFGRLSRRERSRAYCVHGIKQAMLGETGESRRFFLRSICTSPVYFAGYPLLLLSLLGLRPLQYAILKRRELAGNRLGSRSGLIGVIRNGVPDRLPATSAPIWRPSRHGHTLQASPQDT
jgi:glycosyltransferase involved in cell wall biosynthesis